MFKQALARGFTLIELMVAMVVLGILAAIAIPFLVSALDRGRQKRTMADLHSIAEAIELYNIDNSAYPDATNLTQLEPHVVPRYIGNLPKQDGWGYRLIADLKPEGYTIGSGGKDGGALDLVAEYTTSFTDAIIVSNGYFVQRPEGVQQ